MDPKGSQEFIKGV